MDVSTRNLTKRYGRQSAVDDISFTARPGEILGLLGPNGAGKSTTMRMVCGLIAPDAGQVLIDGRTMSPGSLDLRKTIGYLPESDPLYLDMPVLDLLRFGARLQGVPAARVDGRIREMVDACGLEGEKHKRCGQLSRGYRQRAGLAFALVHDPAVLVLDEPTTGLDPNQIIEVRNLIKALGRTRTVIFSTHILPEAEAVCDRILIINKGRIVADGTAAQLTAMGLGVPRFIVKVAGAPAEKILEVLRAIRGVTSADPVGGDEHRYTVSMDTGDGAPIAVACAAHGLRMGELRMVENSLEDVFRGATNP